jgi:hypothetical protein
MTKYKWLLIFLAILAGGLLVWWLFKPAPVDPIVEEMMFEIEALEQRVNRIDQKVRKEVESIRATVKQEISSLTRDDVADALNAELSEFRRLDISPGGVVNF